MLQQNTPGFSPIGKIRIILDSIRFEHTVFALPFAYVGMVLAANGLPTVHQFVWITLAMASARTLAMSSNRIIDRHIDLKNPRTSARPIPSGKIKIWEMNTVAVISAAGLIFAAAQLNTLALYLAPVAAIVVVGYSYTKRFTWTSHFVLGFADGIAPAGAWIGVTGQLSWEAVLMAFAVTTWIGGFDMLYACQDRDFDIENGLHSIPQRFGIVTALNCAKGMHLLTSVSLLGLGLWLSLTWPYYIGWLLASALLVYEHSLVSAHDLSKLNMAFFNVNGYIAVIVFSFTLISVFV